MCFPNVQSNALLVQRTPCQAVQADVKDDALADAEPTAKKGCQGKAARERNLIMLFLPGNQNRIQPTGKPRGQAEESHLKEARERGAFDKLPAPFLFNDSYVFLTQRHLSTKLHRVH